MARRIGDMRKTHEEFMAEMKKKHPNIQITGIYHDRTTNIEWKCSKCGASQLSLPGNLLKPNATGLCRKCFTQQLASTRMKTNEEFLQELHAIHPEIIVKSEYQGASNKIEWKCLKCGESQFSFPSNLLKTDANGICRKCTNLELASRRTKTHEDYLQELHAIHPNIKITGIYQGNNRKIEWECPNCGRKIYSLPPNLLKPTKTPYCKKCEPLFRSSLPRLYDGESEVLSIRDRNAKRFYDAVRKLNTPPILMDAYQNDKSRIRCKCSICGYEWNALPKVILSYKHSCPMCANRNHAIDNAVFIQRLKEINPYIFPLEEYYRQDQHIKCKCLICNHIWSVTPSGLLNQRNGCPKCNHTSTSFFEQLIFLSFQKALGVGRVLSRDKKAIGSELDVYIPDLSIAFEYGAWYYHKNRLQNDIKKLERCANKGIRLIRIYDGCGEEIVDGNDVYSFSKSITINLDETKKLIEQLFSDTHLDFNISDETFNAIRNEAYLSSRRTTTLQFRKKMLKKQPSIEILGDYIGSEEPIACKCKVCGYEWDSTPRKLSSGYLCPNCYSISRKKAESIFIEQARKSNPDIELLEPYTGSNKRILVQCKICGRQWKPFASNLLHGYKCTNCRKNSSAIKSLNMIKETNADVEVIGTFQGTNKPIEVKCKTCGTIWTPVVYNLIKNTSHCPQCSRKSEILKKRMPLAEFVNHLSNISPSIELISDFSGANNRVDVRCKKCGYTWSPRAIDLLQGNGCRKCKYKTLAEKKKRTPEQFVEEMHDINPNILIIGAFTRSNEPVEVKCRECGKTWSPHASSLLRGTGCPSCSQKRRFAKAKGNEQTTTQE